MRESGHCSGRRSAGQKIVDDSTLWAPVGLSGELELLIALSGELFFRQAATRRRGFLCLVLPASTPEGNVEAEALDELAQAHVL
jgi:hypothetical protein